MRKFLLFLVSIVYMYSFVGCAEYKVNDLVGGLMTMNANGQKEIKEQKK